MGLRSGHSVLLLAPKGHAPVVSGTGQRIGANVISVLSNRGQLYFMVFTGRANVEVFISFLRRPLKQIDGRTVFVIVDGHESNKAN